MRSWIPVAVMVTAFAVLAPGASAAPSSFQLVFVGHNVAANYPSYGAAEHVGTFTTNSPLCPSGSGHDIANTPQDVGTRLFTCDGSGATFTATISLHLGELVGSASWQIISRTGPLANLRGEGTLTSVLTAGNLSDIPGNLLALAFRSTWTGTVDLDATPPTVAVAKDTVAKLKRPARTYKLRLALALGDNGGGPVSYTLNLIDPKTLEALVRKSGSTSASSVGWTLPLKPSASTRALRLEVDASDDVGNKATLKKTIELKN